MDVRCHRIIAKVGGKCNRELGKSGFPGEIPKEGSLRVHAKIDLQNWHPDLG